MSANPIDKKPTPNPTGSLEDLFRHHLGEEAAVPPRALLWDQIDNSLLIRQNETYRRRLAVTRWVAAASLLLATLAGTGWWATRYAGIGSPDVATASRPAGSTRNTKNAATTGIGATSPTDGPTARTARPTPLGQAILNENTSAGEGANGTMASTTAPSGRVVISDGPAALPGRNFGRGPGAARTNASQSVTNSGGKSGRGRVGNGAPGTFATPGTMGGVGSIALAARSAQAATTASNTLITNTPAVASATSRPLAAGTGTASATTGATAPGGLAAGATAAAAPLVAATTAGAAAGEVSLLAAQPAALSLTMTAALPNGLAALALPTETEPLPLPVTRKWRYGASYTAGTFNPNINFSRANIGSEYAYNPALGADSPALTEAAAAEYREHLRPGLSQRLALLATRHLGGHWSLRTGAELTQASASSASTSGFVGEQLYDLGSYSTGPRQTTNFRYRLASVPVELRYANAAKRGWSLYGRLGGVVSALLGVRSEVAGNPEATRTYSFLSAGAPYRRILGSLRGGAGVQFRPSTGNWAFTLGPVAELGLVPLNAHPAQSYLAQSRPYGFGVEAGMEFGR